MGINQTRQENTRKGNDKVDGKDEGVIKLKLKVSLKWQCCVRKSVKYYCLPLLVSFSSRIHHYVYSSLMRHYTEYLEEPHKYGTQNTY